MIELALLLIAFAIFYTGRKLLMALNRDTLDRGLLAVADNLRALAEAIARPAADLTEAQTALDDTGTKLLAFAKDLADLTQAEDAEDGVVRPQPEPAPEPQPEPEPAPEEGA